MAQPPMICATCGNYGPPTKTVPGSFLIELVLWLFFLLPGLIYSIWRLTNKKTGCAACGSTSLIPRNSPRGHQLAKEFGIQ